MKQFYNGHEVNPPEKGWFTIKCLTSNPKHRKVVAIADDNDVVYHDDAWHVWKNVKTGYKQHHYLIVKKVEKKTKDSRKRADTVIEANEKTTRNSPNTHRLDL